MKTNQKKWLLIGALLGFLMVLFGAFAAHALKEFLDEAATRRFNLGVRYAAIHALAIMIGATVLPLAERPDRLLMALRSLLLGVVLFSGSLLLLALTGLKGFALFTPLGGLALLAGWGLFALSMRTHNEL